MFRLRRFVGAWCMVMALLTLAVVTARSQPHEVVFFALGGVTAFWFAFGCTLWFRSERPAVRASDPEYLRFNGWRQSNRDHRWRCDRVGGAYSTAKAVALQREWDARG